MALLIRFAILALIVYLFYAGIRFLLDPRRKLDDAKHNKTFYFYDDVNNVRQNFFITYKGALFEGEKYLGTTSNAFDVVSISISIQDTAKLQGFTHADFDFLTQEIRDNYPNAHLHWQGPIQDFRHKKN